MIMGGGWTIMRRRLHDHVPAAGRRRGGGRAGRMNARQMLTRWPPGRQSVRSPRRGHAHEVAERAASEPGERAAASDAHYKADDAAHGVNLRARSVRTIMYVPARFKAAMRTLTRRFHLLLSVAFLLLAAEASANPVQDAVLRTAHSVDDPAAPTSGPLQEAATLTVDSLFLEELPSGPVFVVPIEGTIDNVLSQYVQRAVYDAEAEGAALIIFDIDTFGGLVDAADAIRKTILRAEPTTVAFIDRNAASAGALISYANDRIVMVPGASIGAATVVQGGTGEAAPDKYQSYMRGLMRSTAEANGRDPRIAEAMVDENLEVEGVSRAGQVLTLSAEEARRLGVADAIMSDVEAVVAQAGLDQASLVAHQATVTERVLRFLSSPVLQSLLMLMMMGGLYFELQTPGVGFAGGIAGIGAALFFAPHYMMGFVESWELVLFGIGVVLLLAEIFVIPGFGVAGISGLLLVVGSLFAALVGNIGFQFPPAEALASAIATMAVTLLLLVALMFSLGRYLPSSERFNHLVLAPELSSMSGYVSADTVEALKGRRGVTLTPLRPSGSAEIDGDRVDVIAASEFIAAGTPVQVVRVRGSRVEVRRAPVSSTDEISTA